jgi:hypothetical protein
MADISQSILRRLRDLYDNPRANLEMLNDNIDNFNKNRVAEIRPEGAGYRTLTDEEQVRRITRGLQDNIGGGGMGALGIIKGKGGNWLTGTVEGALDRLKKKGMINNVERAYGPEFEAAAAERLSTPNLHPRIAEAIKEGLSNNTRHAAINNWIDGSLTKYVKQDMATAADPVRLRAERVAAAAEKRKDGALALAEKERRRAEAIRQAGPKPDMPPGAWEGAIQNAEVKARNMEAAAHDTYELDIAKALHVNPETINPNIADSANRMRATAGPNGTVVSKSPLARAWEDFSDSAVGTQPVGVRKNYEFQMEGSPWMANLPDDALVHHFSNPTDSLGFPHMVDELTNALNPNSGLPQHLQLTPEQMKQLGMEKAVDHVANINAWRAAQQVEATRAMNAHPAVRSVRDYADNNPKGLRWVEIKPQDADAWEAANSHLGPREFDEQVAKFRQERMKNLADQLEYEGSTMNHCVGGYCNDVASGRSRIFSLRDAKGEPHVTIEAAPRKQDFKYTLEELFDLPKVTERIPDDIVQIKGKQNLRPKDEYIPFVQDFIRNHPESGRWGKIGDLDNTGLYPHKGAYLTKEELGTLVDKADPAALETWQQYIVDGGSPFAEGGLVEPRY